MEEEANFDLTYHPKLLRNHLTTISRESVKLLQFRLSLKTPKAKSDICNLILKVNKICWSYIFLSTPSLGLCPLAHEYTPTKKPLGIGKVRKVTRQPKLCQQPSTSTIIRNLFYRIYLLYFLFYSTGHIYSYKLKCNLAKAGLRGRNLNLNQPPPLRKKSFKKRSLICIPSHNSYIPQHKSSPQPRRWWPWGSLGKREKKALQTPGHMRWLKCLEVFRWYTCFNQKQSLSHSPSIS